MQHLMFCIPNDSEGNVGLSFADATPAGYAWLAFDFLFASEVSEVVMNQRVASRGGWVPYSLGPVEIYRNRQYEHRTHMGGELGSKRNAIF